MAGTSSLSGGRQYDHVCLVTTEELRIRCGPRMLSTNKCFHFNFDILIWFDFYAHRRPILHRFDAMHIATHSRTDIWMLLWSQQRYCFACRLDVQIPSCHKMSKISTIAGCVTLVMRDRVNNVCRRHVKLITNQHITRRLWRSTVVQTVFDPRYSSWMSQRISLSSLRLSHLLLSHICNHLFVMRVLNELNEDPWPPGVFGM